MNGRWLGWGLALALVGCSPPPTSKYAVDCNVDSDCVAVHAGCGACRGCLNFSIASSEKAEFDRDQLSCPSDLSGAMCKCVANVGFCDAGTCDLRH